MNEPPTPPVRIANLYHGNTTSSMAVVKEDEPEPTISIIIPVKGPELHLDACLTSLLRQDIDEPYEVLVVVEKGDLLETSLREEYPQLCILACEPNIGPGGARNRGIKLARGEYLAFSDADCLCEPDWLKNIVSACRENNDGPVVGWMCCGEKCTGLDRALRLAELGIARPQKPRLTPGIWGSNMCVGRRLLGNVDELFAERIYGSEEIVLLKNLSSTSCPVMLTPEARVQHLPQHGFLNSLWRMYRLGLGAGRLRKTMNLRGSIFARHKWLIPLLPMARMLLTAWRVIKYSDWSEILDFICLSPLVFCYWTWYSAGFAAGASGYIEERFRRPEDGKNR